MKPQGGAEPSDESDTKDGGHGAAFSPSPIDIVVARIMLARGLKLPTDLVNVIFDHAEYWAHSSNEIDYIAEHGDPLSILGKSPTNNRLVLRAFPVGLTGLTDANERELAEELAWDKNEAKPLPLSREHDPEYFKRLPDYPMPTLVRPVRKIVFSICSADQGWGGELGNRGTYKGAWSWFEAGLERFDADQTCTPDCTYDVRFKSSLSKESPLPVCGLRPLNPEIEPIPEGNGKFQYKHPINHIESLVVQRNMTATKDSQDHVITWSYLDNIRSDSLEAKEIDELQGRGRETLDGSFVRDLKLGDVVTLWAKARFPGWKNNVEKVKIDVYWAV
ncbi:hypothetical protein BKA56DRAFT_486020 [Ilyonectria sp. MPI-CAGE-AT-0026]|nr:hypothetical protein BKA56DRAFT_486020 [Ilyonectria sp. MPI-CAGE-AT-0026]